MPKRDPATWQPPYRKHKTGQAVVRICGKDYYLGKHGSPESWAEYARLVAEWRANHFVPPKKPEGSMFISELLLAFVDWAEAWYTKKGKPTGEVGCYKSVVRITRELYGGTRVDDFTPPMLITIREAFLTQRDRKGNPWTRGYVNEQINRLRRIFNKGVEWGYVINGTAEALSRVRPLAKGKSSAPEGKTVRAVTPELIEQTLPHLQNPKLRAMVQIHRLLGCHIEEVVVMRPRDIDRNDSPWKYTPATYKLEHLDGPRFLYWIGPAGQAVLAPLLAETKPDDFLFNHTSHARTGTLVGHYSRNSYARAVTRACERAGIPKWSPGQIRHLRATEIRAAEYAAGRHGGEASQCVLNHTDRSTTEIYADRSEIARQVQARMG